MRDKRTFLRKSLAFVLMALAVTAFLVPVAHAEATAQDDAVVKALDWLRQCQNEDGSWGTDETAFLDTGEVSGYLSRYAVMPDNLEKSAEWMEALEILNNDVAARVLPFIKSQDKYASLKSIIVESQNEDGGWGIAKGYESDILDTVVVLNSLADNNTDTGMLVLQRAVAYIISRQNSDGSWSYVKGDEPVVSLTAQTVIALSSFQAETNLTSGDLQTAMRKAGEFLLSVQKDDKTWGTDEDSIGDTILAYRAVLYTVGLDAADSVDEDVLNVQGADGSWYESPYITALALKAIRERQDMPYAKINSVKLFKNEGGTQTEAYSYNAYDTFEIQVDGTFDNIDAKLLYFVKKNDGSIVSLQSEGPAVWNTGSSSPGDYSVIVQVKDNTSGRIIASAEKQFTINPSLKASTVIVTTDKQSTRVEKPATVSTEVTVVTESNIDSVLSLKLTVTDENSIIASETRTIECKAAEPVNIIKTVSFEPDVASVKDYLIKAEIFDGDNKISEGQAVFKVLPPLPPTRIDVTQALDKSVLYPGEDSVTAQFKLKGEGMPEGPQRMPIDLVLILDSSGSMSGTPWSKTKDAANILADMIQTGDRCAVVGFGSSAWIQVNLVSDKETVKNSITGMPFDNGGTAMDAGLQRGLDIAANVSSDRQVIFMLLSDGYPNSQSAVYTKLSTAIQKGIKIYTLGLGSGVDGTFMQDIANKTGGTYKFSPTPQDLSSMMVELAGEIFDTAGSAVLLETVLPENSMTVDTSKIVPVPSAVINNQDGSRTLRWTLDKLVMGQEKLFEIKYDGTSLVSDTTVLLTKNTKLTYKDRNGTLVEAKLEDLTIPVNKYMLDSELSTDKTDYTANENVEFINTAKNLTNYPSTLTGRLDITDINGNIVAVVEDGVLNTWLAGETKSLNFTWNTLKIVAGKYKARMTWSEGEKVISVAQSSFDIVNSSGITSTITTDRQKYSADEQVNISGTILNNSVNSIEDGLTVTTAVYSPPEISLWSNENIVPELLPEGKAELKNVWNTAKNAPGVYSVTMAVYKDGIGVSQSSTEFEIVPEAEGISGMAGRLQILNNKIYPGDPVGLNCTIDNTGNVKLSRVTPRIRIINTSGMSVTDTITDIIDIDVSQSCSLNKVWTHEPLAKGVYMVVLDAILADGREVPLDSGYITVERPAVLSSEAFKYTLFSGGTDDTMFMYTGKSTVEGDVHSNNSFEYAGSELAISGKCQSVGNTNTWGQIINIGERETGAAVIGMPDVVNEIKEIASKDAENSSGSVQIIDYNNGINLSRALISGGGIEINGVNFASEGYIVAQNNISFNLGSIRSTAESGIVISSTAGDIYIHASSADIKGIIYAPNGTVYINVQDFKLTGRIIAKKIVVNGSYFKVASSEQDLGLIDTSIKR